MAKRFKRAFTIVELVIVIAVIAILAAVLIPTFTTLIDKANQSADEQAVQQMNTILAAEGIESKPKDVEEAKAILKEAGYNVDSYVPMGAGTIFYYDLSENKVLIYDQNDKKVIYPDDLVKKYKDYTEGKLSLDWYILNDKTYEQVTMEELGVESLKDAISKTTSYQTILLTEDFTLAVSDLKDGSFPTNSEKTANIDLNGNSLIFDIGGADIDCGVGSSVRIKNGKIEGNNSGFAISTGASLQIENVEYTCDFTSSQVGSFVFPKGDASEVLIKDCNINISGSASYGITTNANGVLSWDVIVRMENSTLINTSNFAVLVNVPGVYSFKNSTIKGNGCAALIRGGNATFENCLLVEEGDNSELESYAPEFSLVDEYPFMDGVWASGNMVQFGGLVVGDWSSSYQYDVSCKLINTEVRAEDVLDLPAVYLSQDEGQTTTFSYDDKCVFSQQENSAFKNLISVNSALGNTSVKRGNIVINGETYVW